MLLRPALRASPCPIHTIGLQTSKRTFTTSSTAFAAAHRFQHPHRYPHPSSKTATITSTPSRRNTFPYLFLAAGSLGAFVASRPVTYNDTSDFSSSGYSHGKDAKVPLSKDGGRSINPRAIRQVSMGSLMGLGLGVVLSAFSKMLVLVAGLGIVVWQMAARRGYNIVPVERMQRYVRGGNLRSAINDNAAFKISFGLMFALTAFGDI